MLGGFNRVLYIVVELEKLSFDTLTSYVISYKIPKTFDKYFIAVYTYRTTLYRIAIQRRTMYRETTYSHTKY